MGSFQLRSSVLMDVTIDYDYGGPNPKHDPGRKSRGGGGTFGGGKKPYDQEQVVDVLVNHRSLLVFLMMLFHQLVRMQDPLNKSKNSADLKHEKIDDDKGIVDISATEASSTASASLSNDRLSETDITEEKDLESHRRNGYESEFEFSV